jgi:hypothetical protein
MTLSSLFGSKKFVFYREVAIYDREAEKDSISVGDFVSDIRYFGLIEAVKFAKFVKEPIISPRYLYSYYEFIDVEGDKYYIFKTKENYEHILKVYKESVKTFESEMYMIWKQPESESHIEYYDIASIDGFKETLLKLKALSIIFFVTPLATYISTEMKYREDKMCQLESNSEYCEKLSLNENCNLKLSSDMERLENQLTIWKGILNNISYKSVLTSKLNDSSDFEKIEKIYEHFVSEGNKLLENFRIGEQQNSIRTAGEQGELEVEYCLKWIPKNYLVLERDENGIVLLCPDLTDEKQEIDHIVISPQGVFSIETKNFSGNIEINNQGDWIRVKQNGVKVGEKNPIQQLGRHHRVLEHILNISDIFDVICIANDKAVIVGAENSQVPIIKSDRLAHYIETFTNSSGKTYSAEEMEHLKIKINSCRIR